MSINDASCTLIYALEFYDEISDSWKDYGDSPSDYPYVASFNNLGTGILVLNTNDYSLDGPTQISARIITYDEASETDSGSITDAFTITIKD